MQPIAPVGQATAISYPEPTRGRAGTNPSPAIPPADEVELSPEAVAALEAGRSDQGGTQGLEPQEEIALRVLKEAMSAPRRILAGLGLIPHA